MTKHQVELQALREEANRRIRALEDTSRQLAEMNVAILERANMLVAVRCPLCWALRSIVLVAHRAWAWVRRHRRVA